MTKFANFVVAGILVVATLIGVDMLRDWLGGKDQPGSTITLSPNDQHKTRISPHKIESVTRTNDGKIKRVTQPYYGHGGDVIVKKNGSVKVIQKTMGFSNDFGVTLQHQSVGVANEFFYYKRLSVLGGSQFIDIRNGNLQLNLWVGLGYRFAHRKFSNLSVYTGFDTDRRVIAGLFLRLGNS